MTTQTTTDFNSFLQRAYNIASPDQAKNVYNEWARTFDADMRATHVDYVAPALVVDAVAKYLKTTDNLRVLDAGCGTGLVGVALSARLSKESSSSGNGIAIDGLDITPGMLEVAAETKVYRTLQEADLNKPLSAVGIKESNYDVVTCVGTLTHKHVGPSVLSEFALATKPNGIIGATVIEELWESGGYHAEVDKLVRSGSIEVLEDALNYYRKASDVKARILILRKKPVSTFASA